MNETSPQDNTAPPSLEMAYVYGEPKSTAKFRTELEDFIVEEQLGFALAGEGEHVCVHIKKRGENTQWIAEKLAKFLNVKVMDIGLCGMKDRHAETTQWFSAYMPKSPDSFDWEAFKKEFDLNIDVLDCTRHTHKLRRGAHEANHFTIRLRDVSHAQEAEPRLEKIAEHGVPNYFGEQRFGRNGGNLSLARRWFEQGEEIRNRNKRSMTMSAARSYLFNIVLSERIQQNTWQTFLEGDVAPDEHEPATPTGPLWGRGRSPCESDALSIEARVLAPFVKWCDQLEHVGLSQERRALTLMPKDLRWQWIGEDLELAFALPAGQFATSVLREICTLDNQSLSIPSHL